MLEEIIRPHIIFTTVLIKTKLIDDIIRKGNYGIPKYSLDRRWRIFYVMCLIN